MTTNETTVEMVLVTPEIAARWLECSNKANFRNVHPVNVAKYARAMSEGRWHAMGQGISTTGSIDDGTFQLLDGHHRCLAIVMSGVAIRMSVAFNVDPAAVYYFDTQKPRTVADVLRGKGAPTQAKATAAIVKSYFVWQRGMARMHTTRWEEITREEVVDFVLENEDDLAAARNVAAQLNKAIGGKVTSWGAFAFECANLDKGLSEVLFDDLLNGTGLSKGDPSLALRGWMIRSKVNRTYRSTYDEITAMAKTWNAVVAGQRVLAIKVMDGESVPLLATPVDQAA